MDFRLIATDLDGTMFGPTHEPEPPTVDALNAAVDAGIIVVAATRRSWFGGAALATGTGARLEAFIGSNGDTD
ncbi:MAG: HAD hydrolase family protein [Acidimicrobiales bacterium]